MSILACSTLQRPVFFCVSLTAGKWLFSLLFFSFVAPLYEVDSFLFNCLRRWELREHKMRAQMTRLFSCVNQRLRQRYFATAASFAVSLGKLILGKQVPKRKGSSIIFAQNWQLFFLDISSLHIIVELWTALAYTFMCVKLIFGCVVV